MTNSEIPDDSSVPSRRVGRDIRLHVVFFSMAFVVVSLAAVLRVRDQSEVLLPGMTIALPELCTFKRTLGIDCPGCGLTRCFISVAHGRVADAWAYNPAGLLFFAIVAFQIPYRPMQIWRLRRGMPEWNLHTLGQWMLISVAVLMIVQWIIRTTMAYF